MLNIVLFEPEIPANTGNIIRLSANIGFTLHLIKPYGFTWDDKKLRRSKLDYEEFSQVKQHNNWDSYLLYLYNHSESQSKNCVQRNIYALTTKGKNKYTDISFSLGDTIIFGPETRGLHNIILNSSSITNLLRIPMKSKSRSLNLSNSVAIVCYEAMRQLEFPNLS